MEKLTRLNEQELNDILKKLKNRFGEQLTVNKTLLEHHGTDEGGGATFAPDAVLFAHSTEDVSDAMKLCHQYRFPVVPFGSGTSIEGQIQALLGGLSIDLSQMNKILQVNTEDMDCKVQAGVTRLQLGHEISNTGLFFSVDPGADATFGGMAATGASGTNTVRYGTIRENVRGLTVVMADGSIIQTGGRARKSSAGYDLTHLFIGSEGTLGIITELTVKLHGTHEASSTAVCCFPTIKAAVNTVIHTIQCGIPVARVELLDSTSIKSINQYCKMDYPELPHLFMEFHGSQSSVQEQAELVQELATEEGGESFEWATKTEDRNRILKARHDTYPAAVSSRPGCMPVTTDVCVPISRLAECIAETEKMIADSDLVWSILGHVGDGNYHLLILPDADKPEEIAEAKAINHKVIELALSMEGTCSGEHGIGMSKIKFLAKEHPTGVIVMKQIKHSLDPLGILNPGKLFAE
jgi:D-lactate dehydrogenase (cytochrome)